MTEFVPQPLGEKMLRILQRCAPLTTFEKDRTYQIDTEKDFWFSAWCAASDCLYLPSFFIHHGVRHRIIPAARNALYLGVAGSSDPAIYSNEARCVSRCVSIHTYSEIPVSNVPYSSGSGVYS